MFRKTSASTTRRRKFLAGAPPEFKMNVKLNDMSAVWQQRENADRMCEGLVALADRRSNSLSESAIRRTTHADAARCRRAFKTLQHRQSRPRANGECGLTDVGSGAQHMAGAERHATCVSEPERRSCCKGETESRWYKKKKKKT